MFRYIRKRPKLTEYFVFNFVQNIVIKPISTNLESAWILHFLVPHIDF